MSHHTKEPHEDIHRDLDADREESSEEVDASERRDRDNVKQRFDGKGQHALEENLKAINELSREGASSSMVEQGSHSMDTIEMEQLDLPNDHGNADTRSEADRRSRSGMTEPLDGEHKKAWYARWKFWSFIGTTGGVIGSLIFAGLALRQSKPDDPNIEDIKKAKEALLHWRQLSDKDFWLAFKVYVDDHKFSLETQAYLLFYVMRIFRAESVLLKAGEFDRLAGELQTAYLQATGLDGFRSNAIYIRLSEGLSARSADGDRPTALNRGQCAEVANIALWRILDDKLGA